MTWKSVWFLEKPGLFLKLLNLMQLVKLNLAVGMNVSPCKLVEELLVLNVTVWKNADMLVVLEQNVTAGKVAEVSLMRFVWVKTSWW